MLSGLALLPGEACARLRGQHPERPPQQEDRDRDQHRQLRSEGHHPGRRGRATRSSGSSAVEGAEQLPFSLKVLLENLLRTEDGANITADHIRALAGWDPDAEPDTEIQFTPARVIMQDFTGVPCVVDLATMREAVTALGGDPAKVNPLAPAELVIDHSVIADVFGRPDAFERNVDFEYEPQQGALPVPALGPGRVRRLQGRPAGHRHRAPGQHRAPGPRGDDPRGRGGAAGLPRHPGRHRLAHHDGQRPRRARLGRRRHRGRGRHARPARVDAHPARSSASSSPARSRPAPPPPTSC